MRGTRKKTKEDDALGFWLAAAIDDTTGDVCQEFKDDINNWFKSFRLETKENK